MMGTKMTEQELMTYPMDYGEYPTFEDYLKEVPKDCRQMTISAAFECLKRGWKFYSINIQNIATEMRGGKELTEELIRSVFGLPEIRGKGGTYRHKKGDGIEYHLSILKDNKPL